MKQIILTIVALQAWTLCLSQTTSSDTLYEMAIKNYDNKDYIQSATLFDKFFSAQKTADFTILYNASCVYALNNEAEKSFFLSK